VACRGRVERVTVHEQAPKTSARTSARKFQLVAFGHWTAVRGARVLHGVVVGSCSRSEAEERALHLFDAF
jgi:hypothetical protein